MQNNHKERNVVKRIIVIGGGASGMVAAIHAKEKINEVLILEKNERIGKKILATGNGKCNLGNQRLQEECYYCKNPERLRMVLQQYGTEESIEFFQKIGVLVREKNGYLYPYSEQASTVLDALRMEMERQGIKVQCETQIVSVEFQKKKNQYVLHDAQGQRYETDVVIVACGGPASLKNGGMDGFHIAKQLGLPVSGLVPGLVQLKTNEAMQKSIAGVRCQARAILFIGNEPVRTEQGEVQFTDYGISGIPVFQLSRLAAYGLQEKKKVVVQMDFFPDYTEAELNEKLEHQIEIRKNSTLEELQTGLLHKKLNVFFLHKCNLRPGDSAGKLNQAKRKELAHCYKKCEFEITGTNSFQNAQVCAGGVLLEKLTENFEVREHPGVFFVGELLDVDGICGGYNLHWAFATGTIAGKCAKGK